MARLKQIAPRVGALSPRVTSIGAGLDRLKRRDQMVPWRKWYKTAEWVVSRMWWKLPSSGLRACNDGSSQAARSRDIGSRGWDRVSQPSTFRIWI